jgi:hypothetical protein
MPRALCHWALLGEALVAITQHGPDVGALLELYRPDFYAGGMAPDALRLFAGWDKRRSHFYDDQDATTWDTVAQEIARIHPEVADASRLDPPGRAWLAGYLTHITTDVAYWRHILTLLPPFPEHADVHLGAWLLADDRPILPDSLTVDINRVHYESAPPWIEADAVRRLMVRVTEKLLPQTSMWPLEVAYYRARTAPTELSDEDILAEHGASWDKALAKARALLPPPVWDTFSRGAITGAVDVVLAYLKPSRASTTREL